MKWALSVSLLKHCMEKIYEKAIKGLNNLTKKYINQELVTLLNVYVAFIFKVSFMYRSKMSPEYI